MRLHPLLLLAATPLLLGADEPNPLAGTEFAQVTIHERIMIRIRPQRSLALTRDGRVSQVEPVWSERRAQRCVAVRELAGAAVSRGGDVDMMMVDGTRLRAKLAADCPALDFYAGFYLKPNADGRICGGATACARARGRAARSPSSVASNCVAEAGQRSAALDFPSPLRERAPVANRASASAPFRDFP